MSEQVNFSLDGKSVAATPGQTIWDVAKDQGVLIPHLCHSGEPGYRADGNCRACMVEIEGERTLVASCIRLPGEGMVVKSESVRAKSVRQTVIELLLADQPTRSSAHDGSSQLWATAEALGTTESRFPPLEDIRVPKPDASHIAMQVNLAACIHCNLCVRACREVQVNDVIGMSDRGRDARITFDFGDPMGESTCVACGECVQACPKGVAPMDRIMSLREQAMDVGLGNNNGARHAEAFTELVAHSGRLDELRLPVKTVGMFNIPALLSFVPIGLRAMTHGKLPPLLHKSVTNVQNIRRLFNKVNQSR